MHISELLRSYIDTAAAGEGVSESQLREFAAACGDDDEVCALFTRHADLAASNQRELASQTVELGSPGRDLTSGPAVSSTTLPQIPLPSQTPEEALLHNLIIAYSAEAGACALYKRLANLASRAGDAGTESVARRIQKEKQACAEKLWHFLPSRSKIAFNMLTINELDPAVETKLADDRIGS